MTQTIIQSFLLIISGGDFETKWMNGHASITLFNLLIILIYDTLYIHKSILTYILHQIHDKFYYIKIIFFIDSVEIFHAEADLITCVAGCVGYNESLTKILL